MGGWSLDDEQEEEEDVARSFRSYDMYDTPQQPLLVDFHFFDFVCAHRRIL